MDPRVDYRQWLRNTLHAVLEDAIEGDESAKNFLKTGKISSRKKTKLPFRQGMARAGYLTSVHLAKFQELP